MARVFPSGENAAQGVCHPSTREQDPLLALSDVPELDHAVIPGRGQRLAVGRERQSGDRLRMPRQEEPLLERGDIRERVGRTLATGRRKAKLQVPGGDVPERDDIGSIPGARSRGERPAVGREGQAPDDPLRNAHGLLRDLCRSRRDRHRNRSGRRDLDGRPRLQEQGAERTEHHDGDEREQDRGDLPVKRGGELGRSVDPPSIQGSQSPRSSLGPAMDTSAGRAFLFFVGRAPARLLPDRTRRWRAEHALRVQLDRLFPMFVEPGQVRV